MSRARGPSLSPDVLVLGGGAAGLVAAAAARRQDRTVVVLKKAEGATGLSSGAVDVADARIDFVPGPDADPLAAGGSFVDGAHQLAARRPRHPYARLGRAGRERLPEALALLCELGGALGLAPREDGSNRVLASQLGTTKRSALVPKAADLDLSTLDASARLFVADLEDLGNFGAERAAAMLAWVASLGGRTLKARPLVVPRLPGLGQPFENGRQMAAWLDDEVHAAALADQVKAAVTSSRARPTHLLFPPVLGIVNAQRVHALVEAAAGCPVREVLALPQSAPGARLSLALSTAAEAAGAEVHAGTATAARWAGDRIVEVEARLGAEQVTFRPRAVILATGRFFAGGVVRDGEAREPLFGLPVYTDGQLAGGRFIGALTGARPEDGHPIFRAGVSYDEALRPQTEGGSPLACNLFAAGSVLEGYDPARDGSGLGVCALTGLVAGERAAAE